MRIRDVYPTSYENGSWFLEYEFKENDRVRIGYELVYEDCGISMTVQAWQQFAEETYFLERCSKAKINVEDLSTELLRILNDLLSSDNDMWFIEKEDFEDNLQLLHDLETEVSQYKELRKLIDFDDDMTDMSTPAVVVYGYALTEVLF